MPGWTNIFDVVAANRDAVVVGNGDYLGRSVTTFFVLDARTGKEVYAQERAAAPGRYWASPVAANGHIYLTSLEDGTITVLKAGADAPEVVAKNPKLGERVSATPAIADDTLYVRTAGHLYAFAEAK